MRLENFRPVLECDRPQVLIYTVLDERARRRQSQLALFTKDEMKTYRHLVRFYVSPGEAIDTVVRRRNAGAA